MSIAEKVITIFIVGTYFRVFVEHLDKKHGFKVLLTNCKFLLIAKNPKTLQKNKGLFLSVPYKENKGLFTQVA